MKRILLFVSLFFLVVVVFIGCHKDPIDYGNVGVLNLSLQRGYKTNNKSAVESFDARVTIYYSTEDTISYNCLFTDFDGDGRYINDPTELDCIYVRREVGFWVGVQAVIQGDTVSGMSDPTNLLYLPEETSLLDVDIVLVSGYPRIVVSTNTEVDGVSVLLFGEVIEGGEMLEEYAFAVKRGPLTDEEKRLWSKRVLSVNEYQELLDNGDYEPIEAELDYNNPNRFVGRMEMYDLDSVEYSVVALSSMRMNDGDSIQRAIHSPVVSMMISGNGLQIEPSYSQPTGYVGGYGYVDLGLPSGTLWAYTNIGANTPEDYGNYYAWGETDTKETYDWETYRYCNGDSASLTKYCNDESYGLDGFTDSLTTLESEDDVASVSWGSSWRMPTYGEIRELFDNCNAVWTEINGIAGVLFTGTNRNSIFLSAAGNLYANNPNVGGTNCYYWSSTLYSNRTSCAWHLRFNSGESSMRIYSRFCGFPVRPVCVQTKKKNKH